MNWKNSRRIGISCMTRQVKNSEPGFSTSTGSGMPHGRNIRC